MSATKYTVYKTIFLVQLLTIFITVKFSHKNKFYQTHKSIIVIIYPTSKIKII